MLGLCMLTTAVLSIQKEAEETKADVLIKFRSDHSLEIDRRGSSELRLLSFSLFPSFSPSRCAGYSQYSTGGSC